jgi:hypothetical protein
VYRQYIPNSNLAIRSDTSSWVVVEVDWVLIEDDRVHIDTHVDVQDDWAYIHDDATTDEEDDFLYIALRKREKA